MYRAGNLPSVSDTACFEWHLVTIGMTEYFNNIQFSSILTFYYSTIWNNINIKIKQDITVCTKKASS
jgi:hypothetical protein